MFFTIKLLLIGLMVGFVSGLFGKGGSAMATPFMQLIGVSAFSAVASPLPAAIPATLVASLAYLREGFYDKKVVFWSICFGLPSTLLGAWLSQYFEGKILLLVSNLILIALAASFLSPFISSMAKLKCNNECDNSEDNKGSPFNPALVKDDGKTSIILNVLVATMVGLFSGILANSGGFLLAPLYNKVLKLPLKQAFSCSLLVSAVLAVPGTIVHMYLGHISWQIVIIFGLGSMPLSYLGARTAIRMPVKNLEPLFGSMLAIVGILGVMDSLGFDLIKLLF